MHLHVPLLLLATAANIPLQPRDPLLESSVGLAVRRPAVRAAVELARGELAQLQLEVVIATESDPITSFSRVAPFLSCQILGCATRAAQG